MLAVVLAVGSAVSWGLADFLGGLQSRRLTVLAVLLASQATGLVVAAALVIGTGAPMPDLPELLPAMLAGAAGAVALGAFYAGLAIGTMSIVAPISATGAALPVIAGVATGDRPSVLQFAGIAAAIAGVVLASREAHDDERRAADARRSVLLALVAAAGFGAALVGFDASAEHGVAWTLLAARCTAVPLIAAALALALARPRRTPGVADLPTLALVGVLDVSANGLYSLASTEGLLSVVGVLGSLYPVATVVLARMVLRERVRRVQEAGIVLALGGVGLIAGG
ncbi:MAG: EamA family transporter [Solirubrobacteraceae bacterium]